MDRSSMNHTAHPDNVTDIEDTQALENNEHTEGIAIIGMAGRFPGARNTRQFWRNLCNGVESLSFFSEEELLARGVTSDELRKPNFVRAGAVLDDIDLFDASFFGFNARDAEILDPQQRFFLEGAWEALEDAAYVPNAYEGRIGVYAGSAISSYLLGNLLTNSELTSVVDGAQILLGNVQDTLATRVSYKLNLRGPSMTVQTACSTSLVAVHMACQSLLTYQCDMALAGGVSIAIRQGKGYYYQAGGILSPDGHCRAFDEQAQGTVASSGMGVIVLKRLVEAIADGDHIYAVIKGSSVNNDGSAKIGYTAPGVEGQAEVIAEALALANIDPATITYIETHGTGTPLGDPIEIAALTRVFRASTKDQNFCALGAVKTNIGHLDAAAGVTGLLKTALALKHKQLPPTLHFVKPNPKLDLANSPFYVNKTLVEWPCTSIPRRAGVSSFGIGGTNAHAVLEEAPVVPASSERRPWQLLTLSAKTESALEATTTNLSTYLKETPLDIADAAYTLQIGRSAFSSRRAVVCRDGVEAAATLDEHSEAVMDGVATARERAITFMFPGQGVQYVNMARELYENEAVFREIVDYCADLLTAQLGLDLRDVLYSPAGQEVAAAAQLKRSEITPPALFVVEYAMARQWMAWGVRPQAMVGHSMGEYVAACIAGVFSLEDGLSLVTHRGRLIATLPPGAMLGVALPEAELLPLLGDELSLAVLNGPSSCVVAGMMSAIDALENDLIRRGVPCRRLHISHASHSTMVEPVLSAFATQVAKIDLKPPQIPYLSNLTGGWISTAEATDPLYWVKHLRQTVRFADNIKELLRDQTRLLLEIGPGQTLATLVRQHPSRTEQHVILSSIPHAQAQGSSLKFLLTAVGRLWIAGGQIDWAAFHAPGQRQRLSLPTYPFERQRYWIGDQVYAGNASNHISALAQSKPPTEQLAMTAPATKTSLLTYHARPKLPNTYVEPRDEIEKIIAQIWQDLLGIRQVGIRDNFFELKGDSLLAIQLIARLEQMLGVQLRVDDIVQAPTVFTLAVAMKRALHTKDATIRSWSPLVAIQPDGTKRPFFCVHPAGGTVFCYASLARYLGKDQPFYGLQAPGLYGEQAPYTRLEDMAALYITALRTIQPKGPYLLGGWSMGGNVAFEMALQLQSQNERVDLLIMFDSYPPSTYSKFDRAQIANSFIRSNMRALSADEVSYADIEHLDEHSRLITIGDALIKKGLWPTENGVQMFVHAAQLWQSNLYCLHTYRPHDVYAGRIAFFRPEESIPDELVTSLNFDTIQPDSYMADWNNLTTVPLELHVVPGNHHTLLDEGNVQTVAKKLSACLEKAQWTHEN